jgi:DNA polymerase IV
MESSVELSKGNKWRPEDLDAVEHFVRKRARVATEVLRADDVVADESDDPAPVTFRREATWDWMQFGPAPSVAVVCPGNVALTQALKSLSEFYSLYPEERPLGDSGITNELRVLSARRIWNVVRALPTKVTSGAQLQHLPAVKTEWVQKIDQLIRNGELSVQRELAEATPVMKLFRKILWTGKQRCWTMYQAGCRTIDDVRAWPTLDERQKLGLQYFEDVNTPIPRSHVEAYGKMIAEVAHELDPLLTVEILGSHARGEDPCSDVDFLISHPEIGKELSGLRALTEQLNRRGVVKHVLNRDTLHYTPKFGKRQSSNDVWWQSLPDAEAYGFRLVMALARLTPTSKMSRVDFFACSCRSVAPMRLYLTGNVWFNRKLRQHAERNKGYLLCNSAFGKKEGTNVIPLHPKTELEIFEYLGLDYVHPTQRNY